MSSNLKFEYPDDWNSMNRNSSEGFSKASHSSDTSNRAAPKTQESSGTTGILVMVFVVMIILLVVMFITESAYLETVSNKYLVLALLILFAFTKAMILPNYPVWYPIVLIIALLLGGWFLSDLTISTARTGAAFLAVVFILDALYTGYMYRSDNKLASSSMTRYGYYGNIGLAVIIALVFGYISI